MPAECIQLACHTKSNMKYLLPATILGELQAYLEQTNPWCLRAPMLFQTLLLKYYVTFIWLIHIRGLGTPLPAGAAVPGTNGVCVWVCCQTGFRVLVVFLVWQSA